MTSFFHFMTQSIWIGTFFSYLDPVRSFSGSKNCPCLTSDELVKKLEDFANCKYEGIEKGGINFDPFGKGICQALTIGSDSCSAHDLIIDPRCSTTNNKPDFCDKKWCYVNIDLCKDSPELYFRSNTFVDAYRSYSTCDSTADGYITEYLDFQKQTVSDGQSIRVTVPESMYKQHYKLKTSGEIARPRGDEYFDDNIPWEGYGIDFMRDLSQHSNLELKFTHTSQGKNYTSSYLHFHLRLL